MPCVDKVNNLDQTCTECVDKGCAKTAIATTTTTNGVHNGMNGESRYFTQSKNRGRILPLSPYHCQ